MSVMSCTREQVRSIHRGLVYTHHASAAEQEPYIVSVMPCTAKKDEAVRPGLRGDVDAVITTRELARMIHHRGIPFASLADDGKFALEFRTELWRHQRKLRFSSGSHPVFVRFSSASHPLLHFSSAFHPLLHFSSAPHPVLHFSSASCTQLHVFARLPDGWEHTAAPRSSPRHHACSRCRASTSRYDSPLGESTGAGNIFGASGGVLEAALRTTSHLLGMRDAPVEWSEARGVERGTKARFRNCSRLPLLLNFSPLALLEQARLYIYE